MSMKDTRRIGVYLCLLMTVFNMTLSYAQQQTDYKTMVSTYRLAGPYEVVARDGEFRGSKGGSERDMKMAWDCARSGQHEKALEIINAYAGKLQRLDGHDAPLCLIQGYWLCRAMMIEKSLTPGPSPKERGVVTSGNVSKSLRSKTGMPASSI